MFKTSTSKTLLALGVACLLLLLYSLRPNVPGSPDRLKPSLGSGICSVRFEDQLGSSMVAITDGALICEVSNGNFQNDAPTRVVVDYAETFSERVLHTDTVYLTKNVNGASMLMTPIPKLPSFINIVIRRP